MGETRSEVKRPGEEGEVPLSITLVVGSVIVEVEEGVGSWRLWWVEMRFLVLRRREGESLKVN